MNNPELQAAAREIIKGFYKMGAEESDEMRIADIVALVEQGQREQLEALEIDLYGIENDPAVTYEQIERRLAALQPKEQPDASNPITDSQIKYMVNRFLSWRLPENFNPDGGISFKSTFNEHTPNPNRHQPVGTNLFTATQAEAMIRYLVDGMEANHE